MSELTFWFDGACEPNPGGVASFGWILSDGNSGYGIAVNGGPGATNNVAEYAGLEAGLRWLIENPRSPRMLAILGDSKLVVCQVNGEWACRKAHLQERLDRCHKLLKALGYPWTIEWIPREENEQADSLSQKAYVELTGRTFPDRHGRAFT